jgi:hypothetical protein
MRDLILAELKAYIENNPDIDRRTLLKDADKLASRLQSAIEEKLKVVTKEIVDHVKNGSSNGGDHRPVLVPVDHSS